MEDNQKKYVISIPSEDFTGEWTQDMLDQKKDKLIQKYPDARIEEEMDMAADEQYDDNLSYGITLPDGTTERWTGAMMNEKGAKLRKKYPDARISKLAFWSDNQIPQDQQEPQSFDIGNANAQLQQQTGVPAPEAPKAYAPSPMDEAAADEYRAEQKVIQDAQRQAEEEYLASLPDDQREYVELMNSAAGIMERLGTYRDRLDAEDSDKAALRRLRSNDEDALDKVYEGLNNNTYYKAQLARQTKDIETLKDRIAVNAPDILADYPAIKGDPYASRGPEGDEKAANLEAAGRFAEDARKAISAPLRYDDSKGLANYAKGVGSVLSDPDFWTMGITDVQDKAQLRAVLQKVNDAYGSADDIDSKIDQGNLDGILDLDEQYLLQSYLQMQDARSARYHDTSRGYKAGAGSAESAGFMLEMALTSGLGGAVKSGVTKGLGKWLLKGTQKIGTATKAGKIAKATSREAAKLVAGQTGNVLSAAARMPFMPSSYGAIAEQGTVVGDDGQLVSLGEAIKEGTLDNLTEVVTEGMGPATMAAISNTVGAAGLGTLLKKISRTRVGEFARKVANSPAYETMKKMGYDGLGEELLEEFDAAVIDQVRGNPEAIRDFVQTDNLLTTVLSFAPMTLMGGAVSTGQKIYAGNRLEKTAQTLRDKLIDAGYTQSQADYFIDVTRNSTPQEISMVLTPVLNLFAEGNMAGAAAGMPTTGDLFNAVKEYGKAVVRYQTFDGIYQQQEQNQRTEVKNSILEKTGDNFWVDHDNGTRPTVETGTLADGTEVYIVSSVDENGVAAAITPEGKKMFVNAAMLPEGTQIRSLDEYLSEQVMSRKLTAEQKRIEEEKAARAQQVREQAQPGSQINLGTAEAPVIGEVIRQAPDGIIVQTENGVSLLSWDEAANVMNIGAAPLTDEQIEQQEVAQMEAADAEKDAAMAETEEEAVDAVEETEAAQQDEVVSEPLPVKADGSVDQTTLWNQSPERWAQWNDEQRQDGGANSLNYISGAIAKEQAKLDEMTAAYNAESDFDVRSAMEPELAESQDRIARLAELQQKYVPAEQIQEEVKKEASAAEAQTAEETPAAPAVEPQPAEMSEDEARANEIRQTLYDLYNDDSLSEAEIEQYVEANVKGSQEDLDKHMKKAPQMGRDMAKYKEAKAAHEAKAEELRKQRDFWREAQTYVTIPEVSEADMEPQNALEFAARELSSRSGIKLQPESFKRHTGYGSEASKFLSVQRSKAKGGMTLEEAGERLMELDRENNTGFFDQNDPNAGLNAILDVIQSSATSGDLGSYIRNAREQVARQEVAAAREAMMADMSQPAAQEETAPQPEAEFVSTLDEDMPEFQKTAIDTARQAVNVNPTEAQKKAGNYRMGHVKIDGFDVSIENPKGSVRKGKDADGNEWENTINNDYGYIRGTQGVDGDHIDVFLSDNPSEGNVYVIDQVNPETGEFDEHKVMYGFNSAEEAQAAYLSNHSPGWKGLGAISEVSKEGFRNWVDSSHRKTKPFSEYKAVRAEAERAAEAKARDAEATRQAIEFFTPEQELQRLESVEQAKEDLDASYQQRLAEVDTRMAAAQSEEERRAATDERAAVLQQYMDEISSEDKATVLTPYNYAEVMRADGCSEQSIREVEDAVNNPLVILGGFMCNGRIYVMTDVADINRARRAYVHERQHLRTRNDKALIDRVLKAIPDRRTLLMFVELLSGTNDYRGYSDEVLADEIISFAMERAYSAEDFVSSLQYSGIYSQELLNIINDIINEQREDSSLSKARRREGLYSHERRRAQGAGRQNGGAQRAGSSEVAQQGSRSAEGSSERTVSKQVTRLPLPSDNRQLEGNVRFSKSNGTLVGMHNISEEKLRKVIRQGGSANPSTAVVDIARQSFDSYGDISLVMPSSLVDAGTGRNAGTFTADAWTPVYPQVVKRFSDDKLQRVYWKDVSALPKEMQGEVRQGFDGWRDDRNSAGLAYMFLHERGEAPELVRVEPRYPKELRDKISSILNDRTSFYQLSADEKQAVIDLYIEENFGGDREKFNQSIAERIRRIEDRLSKDNVPSFAKKRLTADLDWMKEHGYDYEQVAGFVSKVSSDLMHAGTVNDAATTNKALDYIKENGLSEEFERWKEGLAERYGIKEYLFAGYTPSGNQKWLPNTIENASRLMNKEGLAGSTGLSVNFSRFVATLAPKKKSLSDIRSAKDRLTEDADAVEEFREKWTPVYYDLGIKCQPDAERFEDYGLARLEEAAQKKNPGAYLKKEYGVELSQEDLQKLSEMIKAIKTEFPARYFETKFQRPVYLNEFAAAVMPIDTSNDIKQAVSEAGLPVFEYDPSVEGSRREAALKASDVEGVRFQKSNRNQAIFVSNAAKAVVGIKQEKATPEQWLKMIEKTGGLKAGEDKWMGLSDWLKASDKKTLTKQEVLDFINENMIIIEEVHYAESDVVRGPVQEAEDAILELMQAEYDMYVEESQENNDSIFMSEHYDYAYNQMWDIHGDDFTIAFDHYNGSLEISDTEAASIVSGISLPDEVREIDSTRLDYTTEGLTHKHEIALTVPTIDSWNESDGIHFGDAGEGRAVAWIRFGDAETYSPEHAAFYGYQEYLQKKYYPERKIASLSVSDLSVATREEKDEFVRLMQVKNSIPMSSRMDRKVLVIDEIQSKRHQEGREKGYSMTSSEYQRRLDALETEGGERLARRTALLRKLTEKYGDDFRIYLKSENTAYVPNEDVMTKEEVQEWYDTSQDEINDAIDALKKERRAGIPDAPFDKNWHELAMKRMLRYAAENGYDVIAWTKGEQQAERYNLGTFYSSIERQDNPAMEGRRFVFYGGNMDSFMVNNEGIVIESTVNEAIGRPLYDIVGKDLAVKMMQMKDNDMLDDADITIGGEGMKGFYDKMLPAFMNKYGKKWGVKVEDIKLPNLQNGLTMHSVPVTEEMKESVMEGQVMFQKTGITPEVRQEMDLISANAIMDGTYMLAPNGKPTNLTADQWALVRTEGFKRWFGDWELPYKTIDVVRGAMNHGFANFDEARQWAKDNIVRVYGNEETGGKGEIEISNNAVKKYLSGSAVNKSDSKDLHLAVLKVLPSVIRNGVIAETHADYMKDENGERTAESRINPDVTIHRVYGAVRIGDDIYRVKVTLKEHKDANRANTPHSYEATKIELLAGTLVGANGSNPNTNNSITAANLLNGVEKSYESGKYLLDDHSKVVDENGEPMVVYHETDWDALNEPNGEAVFKMGESDAFYFSNTPSRQGFEYGENLFDFFLNIRKPRILRTEYYVGRGVMSGRYWSNDGVINIFEDKIIFTTFSPSQIKSATDNIGEFSAENPDIRFQIRRKPAPWKTGIGYKVFYLKDGKLYPPMVANLGGVDTPVGVWLDAEEGTRAGISKTGRPKVKQGGKGTQGGSGTLAYRPGWHLGEIPYAIQFNRKDENGNRTLFPADFVWAEVEYADDVDYQEEAMSYGMNANGKFQHSLAGLPKLPVDGSYRYRTNPNPETDPWIITGAMKVNRLLTPSEVDRMVTDAGRMPQKRQEGAVTDEQIEELNDSMGLTGKASDIRFSKTGTPTDKVVNDGLRLSQDESARLAGNIFEALPESARESIVEETFRNGFDMKSAIFQMSARLAEKEELTDEDAVMAKAIALQVENAVIAGGVSMTRPLTTPEALWMLYRHINDSSDIIGAAREAMVADNLGFSPAAQAANERNDDYIRFRKGGDAAANAKASLYNRGAVNVWTRLKESFTDMNASVEELVRAIEKKTGKKAEGFENILMALNQQSSKGLASMEKYERRFLNPMLDEIRRIMTDAKKSYDDIVRYVILKHGLERNELFAKRDAREYYNGMYGKVADRMKTQSHAQRVVALSEAKKAVAAIDAEMATATGRRLERLKEQREQAMYDLTVAELVLRGDEKQNEADLKAKMDDIDAGTDAKYKEFRDKDYSGITSMFYDQLDVRRENYYTEEEYQAALMDAKQDKYKTLADVEAAAAKEVEDFESAADTARLWETINAATKETLRQQYQANMISKDQYDSLREMFKFYVPLRGFKDNTAEDMYTYYRKPNSTGWVKPILAAEGRKTEAESPFGWIANMAGSAIASNVKNEAKLALYYFVSNRPDNGIATITKTWFRFSHTDPVTGRKVYVPAYPPFTEDLSSDAAKASYEKWQQDMKELQKKGEAYESGQRLNLGNAVVNIEDKNKPEHVVNVKIGGKDYSIIINGNPRAAQAINGDLNIESSVDYGEVFGPVLRWMSSVNTSYNPEFWITNMMRDMAFTWMAVSTKESPAYRKKFRENYRKALGVIAYSARNENGKLGSSYLEKMYQEFVDNGGVTGYTQIKDNETWEKEIDKYLSSNDPESRRNGWMMRKTRDFFHGAHRFGESLEQVSRFAAFLTSREMGKSMSEAVSDAKEITVNFNRKGSGKWISFEEAKTLTDKNGQPLNKLEQWAAVGFSAIAPLGRRFIMFFNAAIQGLNATYRLWKANPKRFAGWAAGYFVLGVMNAVLHAFLDDDDDYLDMPEYERRQNLMIGWNGFYLKWAMPQEARAFYALGDLAVESIMGRNAHESILGEALSTVADVLPLNPTEGLRAAVPSVLLPVVEIAINKDYKGSPIYNEQIYKDEAEVERSPKWASAYEDTGKLYIKMAQGLNFITGGDEDDAGFINIQPEKVEHIVESAFGGTLRTANKTINMFTAIADEDTPVRYSQLPFVGRVLAINDERFTNAYVSEVFDFYRGEALHAKTKKSKYEKADDQAALDELKKTDEYKIYEIYQKYNDAEFKALDKAMKLARDSEERRNVRKRQDAARKRMIKEISDL